MASLVLPAILDLSAAAPLRELLLAHRDTDLEVDASNVERLGGLCLQVLLAGQVTWAARKKSLHLVNVSEPCREVLRLAQAAAALGVEG